ncbi:serine hydrolase [Blastomonas sp.]|uniref:serine hydrolase domain-containing protein n=1 Tax=Blastomonas sp. TaxID=1909299 RepID=UPI00262FA3B7|nr:serine hydrolase [Blastomonas sp.]MDM7955877.1 serine hydrolase [Blastomonas sp.]
MRKACALAAIALLASAATPDDTYRARFEAFMANPAQFDYSPMEAVPGAAKQTQLRVAAQPAIAAAALAEAVRYAEANRSSALLVWRDGGLEAANYFGDATRDTPLVAKSLAKPLTAIAIGRAIMLGKIKGLDQPIADFIPELAGTPKAAIRIRHLLDMRSGLLDQGYSPDPDHPWNRAYLDLDHGGYIVRDYPLTDPPGTRYAYANAPSELIALVIERATGRRYAEFVSREVLIPLGAAGGEVWLNRPGGLAHSGCCIKLPAETWMKLAILLLDDGKAGTRRLLPKGYVREMRTGTPQNPSFGLGIWLGEPYRERRGFGAAGTLGPQVLHSEAYLDPEMFLFDGNSNQTVHISPRHRLIVLRMGETPPKTPEWDNAKLPNLLIRGLGPR